MTQQNEYGIEMPYFSDEFLEAMAEKFPDKCPHPTDSDRIIWLNAGRASVVDYLRDQRRRQQAAAAGRASEPIRPGALIWLDQ